MKINIKQIPPEGLTLRERLEVNIGEGPPAATDIDIHVERLEDTVYVRGDVSANVHMVCGRCLKEFDRIIEFPLELAFFPKEEEAPGEESHEIMPEEMGADYYTDEEIDLAAVVTEHLLLNLPIRPLCSEDCKGICPQCGADLNEGECGCEKKTIDPRMEVLKKLLEKRKE
jgi:uncharacterized protein